MAIGVQVTFDAADPARLGSFWAEMLGYRLQPPPPGFEDWPSFLRSVGIPDEEMDGAYAIVDPDGIGPRLFFQKVADGKAAKNRVHLDVNVGGPHGEPLAERKQKIAQAVARAEALGATRLYDMERYGEYWVTMTDPEGNEFCLQ